MFGVNMFGVNMFGVNMFGVCGLRLGLGDIAMVSDRPLAIALFPLLSPFLSPVSGFPDFTAIHCDRWCYS